MRCENCGAPLVASAGQDSVCAYCGLPNAPDRKNNGIGALVDQLLEQVQSGVQNPGSATNQNVHFVQQTTLNVNGKPYENLDQLPPELRDVVSRGLAIAAQQGQKHSNSAFNTVAVSSNVRVVSDQASNNPARRRVMVSLLVGALVFVVTLAAVLVTQMQ